VRKKEEPGKSALVGGAGLLRWLRKKGKSTQVRIGGTTNITVAVKAGSQVPGTPGGKSDPRATEAPCRPIQVAPPKPQGGPQIKCKTRIEETVDIQRSKGY